MTSQSITLSELASGDRVRAVFNPPLLEEDGTEISEASGEIMIAAGMPFLAARTHRSRYGMPRVVDLDPKAPPSLFLIETSEEHRTRIKNERRGDRIYAAPARTPGELEAQLADLADQIASEQDTSLRGRKAQLELQFDDIADQVALARSKRRYILTRARVGSDFHPWTTRRPEVLRIECVRPLPSDFQLDEVKRKDRQARLREAIRIFGEAERETRSFASQLRALGFDVRRPHPNAQELLVRLRSEDRTSADMLVSPGGNGQWSAEMRPPQNKKEAKIAARTQREGHLLRLQAALAEVQDASCGRACV